MFSAGSALTRTVEAPRPRARFDETGGRPDRARRPHRDEDEGRPGVAAHERVDGLQVAGVQHLAEPDDVGPQQGLAAPALAGIAEGQSPSEVRGLIVEGLEVAARALGPEEAAVDFDDALGTGALMEAVHVLGDEQKPIAQALLHVGQGTMTGVRLDRLRLLPPKRIELPDELGIADEAVGRGDVLDPVLLPQAIRIAERREAALRGNPGPGQNQKPRVFLEVGNGRAQGQFFHQLSLPMA